MLSVSGLDVRYGRAQVLFGLSLEVGAGEAVALLGRNGAGKSTTLKAIMGLVPAAAGEIRFENQPVTGLPPNEIARLGLGYVPEDRRIFTGLSVAENLEAGRRPAPPGTPAGRPPWTLGRIHALFPNLAGLARRRAGEISGGEQQMLALARALCLEPSVLLLDEPTEGLQPSMIAQIREVIGSMKETGVATLLVEQRVDAVLSIADRVAFIENGRNRRTVAAAELRGDPALLHAYVGVGSI